MILIKISTVSAFETLGLDKTTLKASIKAYFVFELMPSKPFCTSEALSWAFPIIFFNLLKGISHNFFGTF